MSADRYPDWVIHYEDGTRFSSDQGNPNDSPGFGALFVTQPGINGMDIVGDGAKVLIYRTDLGGWLPVWDDYGIMDQFTHFMPVISCARWGRQAWVPDFKKIANRAAKEMRGR